jgi:NhaA family Na+:H+ antiporter
MLALAAATVCSLAAMNRFGVTRLALYLPVGALLWLFVFKSGIHATIAGVLFALTIPLEDAADADNFPLERLEHALQPWVAFLVLPVFGFANAGVSFAGFQIAKLAHPVTLGCTLGLFAGKQFGIFTSVWLAVRYKLASRPAGATWPQIYGLAMLCGIGFTMSLFIGLLAFANAPEAEDATKIGILIGSLLSASLGWAVLRFAPLPVESRSSGVP